MKFFHLFSTATLLLASSSLYAQTTDIYTCEELQAVSANLEGDYKLMGEKIDCTGIDFKPIGTLGTEFSGTMDGNNVEIVNLVIDRPRHNYVGLFGAITGNTVIQNMNLVDATVHGRDGVGLLVGYRSFNSSGGTQLKNNVVSGKLYGETDVGGLIGYIEDNAFNLPDYSTLHGNKAKNVVITATRGHIGGLVGRAKGTGIYNNSAEGRIFAQVQEGQASVYDIGGLIGSYQANEVELHDSYANVDININHAMRVGGLLGSASLYLPSTVQDNHKHLLRVYSTGNILGDEDRNSLSSNVGGLIGAAIGMTDSILHIEDTYATGNIVNTDSFSVGGLIGDAENVLIEKSYASGYVYKGYAMGGLIGHSKYTTVINSYASGDVEGHDQIGGLIGSTSSNLSISSSYATGKVLATRPTYNEGGLLGYVEPDAREIIISESFWDVQSTQQESSLAGGTPSHTAQMQQQALYENAGWDFVEIWAPMIGGNYPEFH